MRKILEFIDVKKEYQIGEIKIQALKGVDFEINEGEFVVILGASGAGKSTLISLLDKFYEPKQGCIELDGVDVNQIDTQYLRDHIGLVLQKNHIFQGSISTNYNHSTCFIWNRP